jgi:hypothetical protein
MKDLVDERAATIRRNLEAWKIQSDKQKRREQRESNRCEVLATVQQELSRPSGT